MKNKKQLLDIGFVVLTIVVIYLSLAKLSHSWPF